MTCLLAWASRSRRVVILLIAWACVVRSEIRAADVEESASVQSTAAVAAEIDALFQRRWQESGVQPLEAADDATFLRRVTLDVTGRIPSTADVRGFLTDTSPEKRSRVVDDLLQHPRHVRHLAGLWRDVLLPRETAPGFSEAFESWLQTRFQRKTSYDQLVTEILTAQGGLRQSEATVFFTAHQVKPEELAASASRAFLGVEVRCAQCHDHPATKWKQDAFWGFAAFFARVQASQPNTMSMKIEDKAEGEVYFPGSASVVPPRFLDGGELTESTAEPRRAVLARWITSADNPFFARAAANRVWWILFGRGLAEPVDDLGPHNPGTHPEVLDRLAADFHRHGYDLSRLFRIIAATQAYQRSSIVPNGRDDAVETYAAMPVRSLSARQVYDSLLQAAGNREMLEATSQRVLAGRQEFLKKFDVPLRQALEFQGGIPQSLSLLNGSFVAQMTNPATGDLIAALHASPFLTDEQRVDALFLATLSRTPNSDERYRTSRLLSLRSNQRDLALGDILWALLNSGEFVMNR